MLLLIRVDNHPHINVRFINAAEDHIQKKNHEIFQRSSFILWISSREQTAEAVMEIRMCDRSRGRRLISCQVFWCSLCCRLDLNATLFKVRSSLRGLTAMLIVHSVKRRGFFPFDNLL